MLKNPVFSKFEIFIFLYFFLIFFCFLFSVSFCFGEIAKKLSFLHPFQTRSEFLLKYYWNYPYYFLTFPNNWYPCHFVLFWKNCVIQKEKWLNQWKSCFKDKKSSSFWPIKSKINSEKTQKQSQKTKMKF